MLNARYQTLIGILNTIRDGDGDGEDGDGDNAVYIDGRDSFRVRDGDGDGDGEDGDNADEVDGRVCVCDGDGDGDGQVPLKAPSKMSETPVSAHAVPNMTLKSVSPAKVTARNAANGMAPNNRNDRNVTRPKPSINQCVCVCVCDECYECYR